MSHHPPKKEIMAQDLDLHPVENSSKDHSKQANQEADLEIQRQEEPIIGESIGFGDKHTAGQIQKIEEGTVYFHRLGWKRLTVVLLVECIALGSLSLPVAFATLGMVAGVIISVSMGVLAIYAGYVIGQVKFAYPWITHYADIGSLVAGRVGYEYLSAMFVLRLVFLIGSHCLTGAIAFVHISESSLCSLLFGAVSAIILLLLAIPPSFAEVAILGYIDIISITSAILLTIIATGVQCGKSPEGPLAVEWSAWPKTNLTFAEAMIAVSNIVFAYSFTVGQVSFMDEMHTPKDYFKAVKTLGALEIIIYTLIGSIIYAFVGQDVQSPALLSAGPRVSRIAFGIAIPVIFISGSINTTVVAKYIHGRIYKNSVTRFVNTKAGWLSWLALVTVLTLIASVVAESIPFFSYLLAISSALFLSGFSLYFPSNMWFTLVRKGPWNAKGNLGHALTNALLLLVGIVVLVGGTYSSIKEISAQFKTGNTPGVFTCRDLHD